MKKEDSRRETVEKSSKKQQMLQYANISHFMPSMFQLLKGKKYK